MFWPDSFNKSNEMKDIPVKTNDNPSSKKVGQLKTIDSQRVSIQTTLT